MKKLVVVGFLAVFTLAAFMQSGGSIRYNQLFSGDRLGNGTKVQMATGSPSSGHLAVYDASNNITPTATIGASKIGSETIATARLGSGTANSTTFLRGDQTWATPSTGGGGDATPAGAVMSFNLSSCPTGWSEFTAARGRYIAGMPSGGTLAASVGTALTNQENRAVGAHSHTFTGDTHAHQLDDLAHTHTYSQLTGTTSTAVQSGAGTTVLTGITTANNPTSSNLTGTKGTNLVAQGGTISTTGSVSGTNAPYIQLLMCQKD
jgi:hypothetical protein